MECRHAFGELRQLEIMTLRAQHFQDCGQGFQVPVLEEVPKGPFGHFVVELAERMIPELFMMRHGLDQEVVVLPCDVELFEFDGPTRSRERIDWWHAS